MTVRPAHGELAAPTVLAALQELLGPVAAPVDVAPLPGGLTNDNYRVRLPDGREAVLRIPTVSDEALGIDRVAELHNARTAAACGVAPEVVASAGTGETLVRWIDGTTLSPGDLDDSAMLERV